MERDQMNTETGTRVLVLGASGMLGNAVLRAFAGHKGFTVQGSVRSAGALHRLPVELRASLFSDVHAEDADSLARLFNLAHPNVVINCIGLVKQLAQADDPLEAIPINALFPHRLAQLCGSVGGRLVHVSTDCVFDGKRGMYRETDVPDAQDLYGLSKRLGEVDLANAVTLRTSIIGHALGSAHGLLDWFLAQQGSVKGFSRAIFSGLPTVELARVIRDYVIPNPGLRGLYHVSTAPISKLALLRLVALVYGKSIDIVPDDELVIDRSLDSSRFRQITGYLPPEWPELVRRMREFA